MSPLDDGTDSVAIRAALGQPTNMYEMERLVQVVSGDLKLERALPEQVITDIMIRIFQDTSAVDAITDSPIDTFS